MKKLNIRIKHMNKIRILVLALLVSTFLVGLAPTHAYAQETKPLEGNSLPLPVLNTEKVETIDDKVEEKTVEVDNTVKQVEAVKAEVDKHVQTKDQLSTDVTSIKSEIEGLRQKVAEKKRQQEIAAQNPNAGIGAGGNDSNPNHCNTETQWIRADNLQCKDKATGATVSAPATPVATAPAARVASAGSAGNTYYGGQCTWHVKNMRPDLPNSLGNADTWYSKATAMGLPTGLEARVGAAAQSKVGMHVVYVLEVYGNGTMLVSEMNYDYVPYHQRNSIKNQANFYYIY